MTRQPPRYIFSVSTGRCGQNYLADFFKEHVPTAFVAFEEPQVRLRFPGVFGDVERHFRRRFIETNELLGRGRVLKAFDDGNEAALERYGQNRMKWIENRIATSGASHYIDVSKHFIHGLHLPLLSQLKDVGLIRLTRDPIENMRSYLNRRKSFYSDNNMPDSRHNCLQLEPAELSLGEQYLWIWCETQLRFAQACNRFGIERTFSLTTEDLNRSEVLSALLDHFGFPHHALRLGPAKNTNVALGYGSTRISEEDIETFERFLRRVPEAILRQIEPLQGYDPRRRLRTSATGEAPPSATDARPAQA